MAYIYYEKKTGKVKMVSEGPLSVDGLSELKKTLTKVEKEKIVSNDYDKKIYNKKLGLNSSKHKKIKDDIDKIKDINDVKNILKKIIK